MLGVETLTLSLELNAFRTPKLIQKCQNENCCQLCPILTLITSSDLYQYELFPRIDNFQSAVDEIIDIASGDCCSVCPTNGGDLSVKLRNGEALAASISSNMGKVFRRVQVEKQNLIEEILVECGPSSILELLFAASLWQNGNTI